MDMIELKFLLRNKRINAKQVENDLISLIVQHLDYYVFLIKI